MRKRILALLLCLLLLPVLPAMAVAGDAGDPLISQSYIVDVFLPQLRSALQAVADRFVRSYAAAQPAAAPGEKLVSLSEGDVISLASGQQLTLLSGALRLKVDSGTMINATAGRASTGGDAQVGHRYILCGGAAVTAAAGGDALVKVSVGAGVNTEPVTSAPTGPCPFVDMKSTDWFYADVVSAYARGLVNGVTASTYEPQGSLTVAQAVKLAACMHQLYYKGSVSLSPAEGKAWYQPYAEYVRSNVMSELAPTDWNAAISRGAFLQLFFNALPEKEYQKQNLIMDGAIPDVATDAPLAKQVYIFYEAGILTGYAADSVYREHAFGPDSSITRAEVATIMNRMFTPSARIKFTMD